jgi:uncharacterized protein (DUF362 family)/NAD-dependent dihydropyrimidine dehydrogenase PreA subunit
MIMMNSGLKKRQVLIHPASYGTAREAIGRAFDLFRVNIKGKSVLIKPNVLRVSEAKEGIVTHPDVLRAVVEKVEAMQPASIIVGDNPGAFSYGENERAFRATGLMDAAKGYWRNIGDDSREVAFNPDFLPRVGVSRAILDADVVISLPKFKTHGLTVVTGAIKNSYGFLPGAQKATLHRISGCAEKFHRAIVEVFRLRVPDLFIVDAVVGMEGNGPASPDLRDIGLILASDNAVAMDAVIATMMGVAPHLLPFLTVAKEMGLGDYDLDTIDVVGELKPLPAFKLPPLSGEAILGNASAQAFVHGRSLSRPHVDPDRCTGCGTCAEHCPASALSMDEGLPRVDADTCIACFCCQEMCPTKAIAVK